MDQDFCRMLDKAHEPSDEEILEFIGERAGEAWLDIRRYIQNHYDFIPETNFYGPKYGWTIRYRKSGKTLCSLFPEKGGFTVLITLGKKEFEEVLLIQDDLSPKIRNLFKETKQLRDGHWLWIRMLTINDTNDIKKLMQLKRKPKNL